MLSSRCRLRGLQLLACLLTLLTAFAGFAAHHGAARTANTPAEDRPRLAVLIIFDQLRGDYLQRWGDLFGEGGFRRLKTEGAWFPDCHYPYANTVTAVGHASIATGCPPRVHGIVGNDWYDQARGALVYCVGDERCRPVPPSPGPLGELAGRLKLGAAGSSPVNLLAPALGDALKQATGGQGRVLALSLKDRSAILPGGHRADGCYWFDLAAGIFTTSSYYRDQLPSWVAAFNRGRPADRWFGRTWQRFRPDLDYVRYSGPDDGPGEGNGASQGRTFPHPMTGGQTRPGVAYYAAVYNSPYGNDLLLDLARRALDAEHLGRGSVPDLLCLSFSSNDAVGHCFGPDSQEVLDITLRSDRLVKDLLDTLDARVGKGRYVVAVSSDHGVCPLPEVARRQGKDAGRVDPKDLMRQGNVFLSKRFGSRGGQDRWIQGRQEMWLYLNQRLLRERGLKSETVEAALAEWLERQPGIQAAYPRARFDRDQPVADPQVEAVRLSSYPGRSGDVAVILKPYYLAASPVMTGTNHGTPHSYDTHVPLLVYGPGIRGGTYSQPVTPLAIPAILAHVLGIAPPARAESSLPEHLFAASRTAGG